VDSPGVPAADLRMREAGAEDVETLLALYAQPGMDNGRVLDREHALAVFAEIMAVPGYRLHLAELDGIPVGTFALLIMPNLGHCGSPSGVLEDIVVDSGYRGRGIGRCMVAHAIALCRAAGCYKLALSSNLVRTGAHAFYDRLGFERHGYSFRITP
jgi:GNAT superfamily N-acetyltransferase